MTYRACTIIAALNAVIRRIHSEKWSDQESACFSLSRKNRSFAFAQDDSQPLATHLMATKSYYVYIMTNASRTLYVGVTKTIKGWLRAKKIALIESVNPKWQDLSTT
jgi:hypothetical protein